MVSETTIRRRGGFTLVELTIAAVLAALVISGVGFLMVDGQKGWLQIYNRVSDGVTTDGYVASKTFDKLVRKASRSYSAVNATDDWVELGYYQSLASGLPDRYALMYESSGDLKVEYGIRDPKQPLTTTTLCSNVVNCEFQTVSGSVQMILSLDDGSASAVVMSSAVMHN